MSGTGVLRQFVPKFARLGSREPLVSVALTDYSLRCGAKPGCRVELRPGLLLKMLFGADARPPIKMGTF